MIKVGFNMAQVFAYKTEQEQYMEAIDDYTSHLRASIIALCKKAAVRKLLDMKRLEAFLNLYFSNPVGDIKDTLSPSLAEFSDLMIAFEKYQILFHAKVQLTKSDRDNITHFRNNIVNNDKKIVYGNLTQMMNHGGTSWGVSHDKYPCNGYLEAHNPHIGFYVASDKKTENRSRSGDWVGGKWWWENEYRYFIR